MCERRLGGQRVDRQRRAQPREGDEPGRAPRCDPAKHRRTPDSGDSEAASANPSASVVATKQPIVRGIEHTREQLGDGGATRRWRGPSEVRSSREVGLSLENELGAGPRMVASRLSRSTVKLQVAPWKMHRDQRVERTLAGEARRTDRRASARCRKPRCGPRRAPRRSDRSLHRRELAQTRRWFPRGKRAPTETRGPTYSICASIVGLERDGVRVAGRDAGEPMRSRIETNLDRALAR